MKNFFSSKLFIAIIFFIVGGLTDLTFNWYVNRKEERKHRLVDLLLSQKSSKFFDNLYNDDFFDQARNPFSEMRRIQKQLMQNLETQSHFQSAFDEWYKRKFGGDINEIKQTENSHFISYYIRLPEAEFKNFKVEIKNNEVLIFAEEKIHKNDGDISESYMSAYFRSIPAPKGVKVHEFKIKQTKNFLIIKFPKSEIS